MGGKSTTSTQSVSIPPEVLARYSAVNTRAESVAQQPFQEYGGSFVAPVNQQQQAGFANINQAATSAQPYYGAAAGMTLAGSQGVGPLTGGQIGQYMSPYLGSVVGTTLQNLGQEQAVQRQGQIGDAIKAGAYGGDRSGLAAANLARQQGLAYGQTAAGLLSTGYGQAVQTAQGQQQVQQADLSRLMQGGAQLGGLGAQQQQAALQGAQAQVGAGTLQQQTEQADATAKYQQFLQQRGYDFQVAQFLANIAMGTGALSGSTTTTTQPQSLFSDERLKENIAPVGELADGQTIYRYNYKGDPKTQIGLIAQEVERDHPEAVGESGGFRTVDYGSATDEAASMASRGGLVPSGMPQREAFAPGGLVDPNDLQALIASQAKSFGPFSQAGLYGGDKGGGLGASGYVPSASLPSAKLITAGSLPQQRPTGLAEAMGAAGKAADLGSMASKGYDLGKRGLVGTAGVKGGSGTEDIAGTKGLMGSFGEWGSGFLNGASGKAHGGLVPGYAGGGEVNPYEMTSDPLQNVLEDQQENKIEPVKPGQMPSPTDSGLGDAIKAASSIASMFAMSDERLKDNIEPVGKLYDGQPVYRYDMGGGPTQLGLMAQEAGLRNPDALGERDGYLMLNYDRATRNAARGGYANGGETPDIRQIIIEEATKRGIPPELALRQAQTESSMNPNATGKSGEVGLFQVMPSTARDPGYGVAAADPADLRDPRRNAGFGLDYLKALADRRGLTDWSNREQVSGVLGRYNGGGDPRYAEKVLGRGDASAYAGKDTAPASAAIERAAPRGGLSGDADNKVLGLSPPNKFGSEQPQGWGDFLASKQFIVPLLSAVGAAATTPTRNLGTAIAAGLGAGAQSYVGLEKGQADVEGKRAETRKTETDTYQKSFMQTPYGNFVWLAGGDVIPAGDYDKLRREGRAPDLLGRVPDNAEDVIQKRRAAQAAVKGAPPAGAGQPSADTPATAPVTPVEKEPLPPSGLGYDKRSQSTAQAERNVAISGGPEAGTAQDVTKRYIDAVVPTATAARDASRYLTELASNLSKATQGKGLDAPGFGFEGRAQVTSALNTFSRAFGGGEFGQADTIAEINRKIETLQAAVQARGGNQESFAALNALRQAIASPSMSPRAYSKLAADMLAQNQRAVDREQHRSIYASDSSGLLAKAAEDFERTNPSSKYNKEAEVIQKMILTKPSLVEELRSGKYTPKQIDEAFDKLGVTGMSRYFVGGR